MGGPRHASGATCCPTWRGREIDKTDGFLLLFDSSADAIGLRARLPRRPCKQVARGARASSLRARAGVHVGEVVLRENPLRRTSHSVRSLSKSMALPSRWRRASCRWRAAGQTLLTDARRRGQLHGALPDGTRAVESPRPLAAEGRGRARGSCTRWGVPGEAPFAPPEDAAKAYRVVQSEAAVASGRARARSASRGTLTRSWAVRMSWRSWRVVSTAGRGVVTVLGPGGTGKTRLVTRHAWTWLGDYPGGAWFCDLSEARSLDGIAHALARTLDVPLGQRRSDRAARPRDRGSRALPGGARQTSSR